MYAFIYFKYIIDNAMIFTAVQPAPPSMIRRVPKHDQTLLLSYQNITTVSHLVSRILVSCLEKETKIVEISGCISEGILTFSFPGIRISHERFKILTKDFQSLSDICFIQIAAVPSFGVDPLSYNDAHPVNYDGLIVKITRLFQKLPVRENQLKELREINELRNYLRQLALLDTSLTISSLVEGIKFYWKSSFNIETRLANMFKIERRLLNGEKFEKENFIGIIVYSETSIDPILLLDGLEISKKVLEQLAGKKLANIAACVLNTKHFPGKNLERMKPEQKLLPPGKVQFTSRAKFSSSRPLQKWSNVIFHSGKIGIKKSESNIEETRKILPDDFERIIGNFNNEFIIVQRRQGIIIIDQHAADERIRLERFISQLTVGAEKVESTFFWSFHGSKTKLIRLGFIFNGDILTQVPKILSDCLSADALAETADPMNSLPIADILMNQLKTKACRGAIMFGDKLDKSEMERIVKDLSKCEYPGICAHGRPSIRFKPV